MSETANKRTSFTLVELGVILLLAATLGGYVWHRATEARIRAVVGTLKSAGAKVTTDEDGAVRSIDMTAMPEDQIDLKDIVLLSQLRVINLDHSETQNEHLSELRSLQSLTALHLVGTAITDAACAELTRHSSLKFLDLRANAISDEGVEKLTELRQMTELRLAQTWISDRGLKSIAGLPELKTLDLRHTDVTDEGLNFLAKSAKLRTLLLTHSRVTHRGVAELLKVKPGLNVEANTSRTDPRQKKVLLRPPDFGKGARPERVHISEQALVDELNSLNGVPLLTGDAAFRMSFRRDRIGVEATCREGFLVSLKLRTDSPPKRLIPRLARCRNLEKILLGGFPLEDDTFSDFHRLRFLRYLTLEGPLTDRHLADICRLRNIARLALSGSKTGRLRITDEALKSIAELAILTDLHIVGADITDDGLRNLTFEKTPLISFVRLSDVPNITREGVYYLLRNFPEMRNYYGWISGDSHIQRWAVQFQREEARSAR